MTPPRRDATTNVVPPGSRVSRRGFLELLGLAGAAGAAGAMGLASPLGAQTAAVGGGAALPPGYAPGWPDGVMSGDPQPDGTVLWTRVADPGVADDVPIVWEVAEDAAFGTVVAGGMVAAGSATGRTAKVVVTGLASDRWYHYRFSAAGSTSPAGRLRTAPGTGASPDSLTLAWCSCQQRSSLFVAQRAIANEPDLDLWMHLGDYVYVNDVTTLSLDDYRSMYRLWRTDADLRLVQAQLPTVAVWDDGEFYNGIDRTGDPTRLANAMTAWVENFPIVPPGGDPTRIHRSIRWGDLVDLVMIDTRQYRDPAIDATDTRTPEGAAIFDPSRTTLGTAQRAWLLDQLDTSAARWRALGNSYNFGMWRLDDLDDGTRPLPPGVHQNEGIYAPNEAWDDYWAEREAILEHLAANGIDNTVSLSGHTHIWIASALSPDPDDVSSPLVGYDFTCGSLTSDPDVIGQAVGNGSTPQDAYAFYRNVSEKSREINPWQAYVNFHNFGYGVATFTRDELVVEYKAIDVHDDGADPTLLARFVLPSGDPCAMSVEYFDEPLYNGATAAPTPVPHLPWQAPCQAVQPPTTTTTADTTTTTAAPGGTAAQPVTANPSFTG